MIAYATHWVDLSIRCKCFLFLFHSTWSNISLFTLHSDSSILSRFFSLLEFMNEIEQEPILSRKYTHLFGLISFFRAEILGYGAIGSKKFCGKNLHWNWAQMVILINFFVHSQTVLYVNSLRAQVPVMDNIMWSLGNKNWFLFENVNVMMCYCIETDVFSMPNQLLLLLLLLLCSAYMEHRGK